MGIAEQMGKVLQRTSISVNIKERLDFSCALFGPDGSLVWLCFCPFPLPATNVMFRQLGHAVAPSNKHILTLIPCKKAW